MKDRAPLGGLVRGEQAMISRYEREITDAVFSSLEESVAYAMREELGPSWGIYCDSRGFRLYQSTGTNTPQGFVRRCPPLPPPPPPPKWGGWCAACGSVIWAGQAFCSDCGWAESGGED